ncbi:MAG: translation initiation factor IF-1 [Pseudomonadales bacterium]
MHQERLIRFDGSIVEALPDARYRVRFSNGQEAITHAFEDMERPDIADLTDQVFTVELSPDDLGAGRLIFCSRAPVPEQTQSEQSLNGEPS